MRRPNKAPLLATLAIPAFLAACSPAAPAPAAPPKTEAKVVPACESDRADCDGKPDNGCEADLHAGASCGACGVTCSTMESCLDGRCRREHTLHAGAGACAIRDGHIYCWGNIPSDSDQFEASPEESLPHRISEMDDALTVRFSPTSSFPVCAASRSGQVKCFFTSEFGKGPERSDAVDVAAYGYDVCAVTSAGHVYCGDMRVKGISGAIAITSSDDNFFVLRKDGTVAHIPGMFSSELEPESAGPPTKEIPGLQGAIDIAASYHSFCALLSNGKVRCSELDYSPGALREVEDRPLLEVPGLSDAVAMDIGCAVRANGEAVSWPAAGKPAAPIPGVKDAKRIACGLGVGCYERADGAILCWGSRRSGRLGDGAQTTYDAPVEVPGINDAVGVAAGTGTCVLRRDGTVWCWGTRQWTTRRGVPPERVPGIEGARALISSFHRACAITASKVHCFSTVLPLDKVAVYEGLGDLKKVLVWDEAGIALRASGEVVFFAAPDRQGTFQPTTLPLTGLADAVDIAADNTDLCVVRKTGVVACASYLETKEWLEKGAKDTPAPKPPKLVPVPDVRDALEIGGDLTMHIRRKTGLTSALVRAPQPGTGAKERKMVINTSHHGDLGGVTQLFGSGLTACAIAGGGQVFCESSLGGEMRGTGQKSPPLTPQPVKGIADAVAGAAGRDHVCVVRATGKVACWGSNDGDALGAGDPPVSLVPVEVNLKDALRIHAEPEQRD